jgi:hypothetical protein
MLSNSYNNDKYSANSTSIFVPMQYKPQIDAVIAYQNTQQGDNGEFICAIECVFGFGGDDNDYLLCTTQWGVFKGVLQKQTDPALLLAFFMDLELPQVDDDVYIKSAVKELGNVWFCNDWLLEVPLAVHHKADDIAEHYDTDLRCITPVADNQYNAWFTDESYTPDSGDYWVARIFQYADGVVTDNTFDY